MKVNKKFMRSIASFCVVIALVMCVGLIPFTAQAESLKDFDINLQYELVHPDLQVYQTYSIDIENYGRYSVEEPALSSVCMDYKTYASFTASIENSDGSLIAKAGETFELSISGVHLGFIVSGNYYTWTKTPDNFYINLVHTDGTMSILHGVDWTYSSSLGTQSIKFSTTAVKDVSKIVFYEDTLQYDQTGKHGYFSVALVLGDSVNKTSIEVEIDSKEVGLLEDIGDELSGVNDNLSSIEDQLNTSINGTPQQNQQAQDAVGGLNSSTDKLGELGDTMAGVDKPSIDSNDISAGSLVPSTSLVVLSSPFQALWENKQLMAMLTIVVTLVLVSWVFFGKKA